MSEELNVLYRVQELDLEIARRKQALAGLDAGEEVEQTVAALDAELGEIRRQQDQAEKESLDRELEAKTLEEKRDRFRTQLYGGKVGNPRQLADLQGEVAMLDREIGKLEERLLELLELMESHRAEIAKREVELAEARRQLASTRAAHEAATVRLRQEITELETQRAQQVAGVSVSLLKRYEQIRPRAGNVGIVRVTGLNCAGCKISLPSDTLKDLKSRKAGLTCDNCGRLLLWGGPEGAGQDLA